MTTRTGDVGVFRTMALVATASVLLVVASAFAQPKPAAVLPDTIAGTRAAGWLAAFNSGDEGQMRQYFTDNLAPEAIVDFPIEERLGRIRAMRADLGTLALRKVVQAGEGGVTVVAASRDEFVQLTFELEAQPPHRLLRVRIEPADDPNLPPPPKMSEPEAMAAIEREVGEAVAADRFSGTVLVARNGKPLLLKAWGLASVEHNAPNRTDTKYNLGSINKLFTALAIGQLAQAGKLSFDDTLGKLLPDYPNADARQKVTVRHLLEMRSGIGDFFGERFDATPKEKIRTLKDYLPLFADQPLLFEPGTSNKYSNGGYVVLGLIIEKASGVDYYTYVRENIFKPCGMTDTDSYARDAGTPNLALGYAREGEAAGAPRVLNFATLPGRGSSAGGGYSTAADMLKYVLALNDKKIYLPDVANGLGIAGGAPGINSVLEWDPRSGYIVIVLTNFDPPAAGLVARRIASWLPQ
jgi:D-alanyl-D-alanine carboxypeptidase